MGRTNLGVVHLKLAVARVDDEEHAVDGQAGLGDVGCHDDLAVGCLHTRSGNAGSVESPG